MDLYELPDGSEPPPARPSRFAPKGSKPKPKPKPKLEPKPEPPSSSASLPPFEPKKEEVDEKPKHENTATAMDVGINLGAMEVEKPDNSMEIEAEEAGFQPGDEDEVVREIEVYFSPSVDPKTQLYLFQYPLRPVWRPYELDDRCDEVRVKPETSEVEVDLAIDVDSTNYDASSYAGVQLNKQTLASLWRSQQSGGCTVGVLVENKLHLNPIHAVVQLKPSTRHLEEKESKKKTAVRNNVEDVVKSEEHQEVKPSKMPKKQKAPEQTEDSGEVWVPLKYHSVRSDLAVGLIEKMITRGGSPIQFSTSSHDYLNSLCPANSRDNLSSNVTRRSLLALPLKERFKTRLLEAPLHRFNTLKHLAPDESIEEVLEVLQELAVLVQGLWVAKTSVVYEADNGISVSAKDQAVRESSRDNVLLLFSKDPIISNSQLPSNPQRANAMKAVLHGLAAERPFFKDWKLKELPDFSFIKHYPAVVKKQQEMWDSIEKKFNSFNSGGRYGLKTSKSSTPTNNVVSKGSDKIAASTSGGSEPKIELSAEVRENIRKSLQKIFKSTKTCSFQNIIQKLREIAVSESARATGFAKGAVTAANCTDAELQAILSEVAVNIHGICVLKSSPDHPQYDDLRKVVIDLFLAEGPNAKLKRASINEAANMKLEKAMGDAAYKKVLSDLCVSQGSAWILRRADHSS